MAQPTFNPNENNSVINVSSWGYANGAVTLYRFSSNTKFSVSTTSNTTQAEFSLLSLKINTATPVGRGTSQTITVNNFIYGGQTNLGDTRTGATVSEFLQLIYPIVANPGPARGNVSTLDYSTLGPRQVITYQTIEG